MKRVSAINDDFPLWEDGSVASDVLMELQLEQPTASAFASSCKVPTPLKPDIAHLALQQMKSPWPVMQQPTSQIHPWQIRPAPIPAPKLQNNKNNWP